MRRPAAVEADDLAGEVEALQTRLADAASKNKKLLALVHQQHGQIQVGGRTIDSDSPLADQRYYSNAPA